MHGSIMEWTNDDALELIEQYRSHTELWNRADPKYKDKLCRFRAWSEIADRFGCSKAEVERKMNVLLTQYRREKHKMLVKLYQGIQPNPSKWYAFKRFDFMEAGGGGGGGGGGGVGVGGGITGASLGNFGSLNMTNNAETNTVVNSGLSVVQSLVNGDGSGGSGCSGDGINHHPPQTANGRQHNHPMLLNGGTTTTYVSTSNAVSVSNMPILAHHHHHHHHHHRRTKGKEMKYFGADFLSKHSSNLSPSPEMGMNLPILLATSQSLDTWSGSPYSPPTHEVNQMRVPLPLPFSAPQADLNPNPEQPIRPCSFFGDSMASDTSQQSQKPMDTSETSSNKRRCMSASAGAGGEVGVGLETIPMHSSPPTLAGECNSSPSNLTQVRDPSSSTTTTSTTTTTNIHLVPNSSSNPQDIKTATHHRRMEEESRCPSGDDLGPLNGDGKLHRKRMVMDSNNSSPNSRISDPPPLVPRNSYDVQEVGGQEINGIAESRLCGGGGGGGGRTPREEDMPHNLSMSNVCAQHQSSSSHDLNIKQELLMMDYFHTSQQHPVDSQRLFANVNDDQVEEEEEEEEDADEDAKNVRSSAQDQPSPLPPAISEFAQDLRVHASVTTAKSLEFSRFILRPSDSSRHSSDGSSSDEKYRPLNMQKLSNHHGVIMSSLLGRETTTTATGQLSEDHNHHSLNCVMRRKSSSLVAAAPTTNHNHHHSSLALNGALNGAGIGGGGGGSGGGATVPDGNSSSYIDQLPKDDCDFIGSNVTAKLRGMERAQRIIAEKLISEVLFYGQLRELERSAHILPK